MKNLMISILLASLLAACGSKTVVKEPPVTQAPVASMPAPKAPANPPAESAPIVQNTMEINPLTDPNNILSKRSVYFDYDNYSVKAEYENLIAAHAKYLLDHPSTSITIQGNTDERGSREYNLALGQKRASAVKMALSIRGVPDKQIETVSYGMEKPKATGHDESAWSQNRRSDIVYQGE
jgi:peptidoglycan-associated lipoprotein